MTRTRTTPRHALRWVVLGVCFWLGGCFAASAADRSPQRFVADDSRVRNAVVAWAAWVEFQAMRDNVPAISYGLVQDQELIVSGAFGLANPATGHRATPDTLYSICSISKLFTSIGIMQLRDAQRLRLDDPVIRHLPQLSIQDRHPHDRPITIRGLLTHASGLPREADFPYWTGPNFEFPTRDQIQERLREQQTLYPSERYFQYSNLGMTLAGEVIAASTERPYSEYIRTNVLEPLKMKDTLTDVPKALHGTRLAVGYSAKKRNGERDPLPPFQARGLAAAAGLVSNVGDLAKFASWQFRALANDRDDILRPSTLRQMQQVHWVDPDWKNTRGLGFSVRRAGSRTLVGHAGGCPGYFTHFVIDPKAKVAAIVLSNAIGAEVTRYARTGLAMITPAVEDARESPRKTAEPANEFGRYVGVYGSAWGELAVIRWKDGLAALWLATRDPIEALTPLLPVSGRPHTFRRIRKDDGQPAERFVFEMGAGRRAKSLRWHSNVMKRLASSPR